MGSFAIMLSNKSQLLSYEHAFKCFCVNAMCEYDQSDAFSSSFNNIHREK